MKATWIWYPGDFEVWLGNKFNNRRTERGAMFPPFWKQDSHWPTVVFTHEVDLEQEEVVAVWTEGEFNFMLDGKLFSEMASPETIWYEESDYHEGHRIRVPIGRHTLTFKVWNQTSPPALFVDGKTIKSSSQWLVTYEDKIWIDEQGVAHGSGVYVPAGSWNFNDAGDTLTRYSLRWRDKLPVNQEKAEKGMLYDFGRESFGHLDFRKPAGSGTVHIYYGESREEALDKEHCETLDRVHISNGLVHRNPGSKAFRYVYVETTGNANFLLAMYEEYAPFSPERSGSFRCSDDELNKIWEVSAYTLELTTQEFFMDGIKRDRWVWSGDAIQSYLMNYYLHFDTECVKRTIRQLRGKDPVTAHVNTIMDYTFYWFKSIADYYEYTGDTVFIRELWPKMVSLMDYCLSRLNTDGMVEGQADDWIFIDWVDFPMHKRGTLCFEQLLLAKALDTMSYCAVRFSHTESERYARLSADLLAKTKAVFWSPEAHAYLHAIEDGQLNPQITKFPNMFAILYDFASEQEKKQIQENVLLNADIPAITTPYMRFYELEALCQMGQQAEVLPQMKAYWGGMLREGATTFWEKYNPAEHGTEHLAMYGRPYGKSLCHAWGASPLYIIGRYFLGVKPTKPGYQEYEVRPVLGGLEWMEGEVPTPFGKIRVKVAGEAAELYGSNVVGEASELYGNSNDTTVCNASKRCNILTVQVFSDGGKGTLILGNQRINIPANKEITINL